jgi:hypothetical protein
MVEYVSKASWRNPEWKYTPASATNVARTIARVRKELKDLHDAAEAKKAKKAQAK